MYVARPLKRCEIPQAASVIRASSGEHELPRAERAAQRVVDEPRRGEQADADEDRLQR